MKFLKNITLSLFLATSTVGISSIAVADYITDSIDQVSLEVSEISKAIEAGSTGDEVVALIRKVSISVKRIPQGDNIDIKRQRANAHLKKARRAAKKGDLEASQEHLTAAAKGFADLRSQF